jgi:putative ABC transport system permease protein
VIPAQNASAGGRARTGELAVTLRERDYREIRRLCPEVSRASAIASGAFLVKAGNISKSNCLVVGCEPDFFLIRNWPLVAGTPFALVDLKRGSRLALLGSNLAQDLYGSGSPIGRRIFINRVPFEVVGVLAQRGQGLDSTNEDEQIYIPLSTVMHRLMNIDFFSAITLEIQPAAAIAATEVKIAGILHRLHRPLFRVGDDFQVQDQQFLIETQAEASARLGKLAESLGWGGLFVSGIGILAVAWIAMRQRIVEFGTRRALGATSADILFQIGFEAASVSIFGCLVGFAIASGLSMFWNSVVGNLNWGDAAECVTSAIGLNLAVALLPAAKAAKTSPMMALRSV